MRSSAIKKGLAVAAVSALAVTGLGTAASATSVDTQVGTGNVVLYSQFNAGNEASLKADGTDSTVHLEAGAGSDITSVTFQYQIGAAPFVDIATASRGADGTFTHEWNAASIAGSTVTLRAVVTGNIAIADTVAGVEIVPAGGAGNSVNITAGTTLGYYQPPGSTASNVIVSGTTSSTTIADDVSLTRLDGAGAPAGALALADVEVAMGATSGTFRGVVDLNGYAFDTNPNPAAQVNQVVIGAELDSDDTEAFTLKKQAITTVTAVADRTQVQSGQLAKVTVTVKDADGNPIAGAKVDNSPESTPAQAAKTTDANGQVVFDQGAGSTFYYADATTAVGYQDAEGDKKTADVAVTSYNPAETSIVGTSVDGAAFDFDENVATDISVQVKDQANNDSTVNGRTVQYYWQITPFAAATPAVREPLTGTTNAATANGKVNVVFPVGKPAGTYELFAALQPDGMGNGGIASAKVLTVKAGEAAVVYTEASPESAPAGDQEVVEGKLALEDGTGLATRDIAFTYVRGAAGSDPVKDAGIVPETGNVLTLGRTIKTTAAGAFSLTIDDPAETPQGTELGGNLAAAPAGNADAANLTHVIDFTSDTPPTGTTVTITDTVAGQKPGTAVNGTVTLTMPDGPDAGTDPDPVAGQQVTLKVAQGFFTDGTPDPTPVLGADAGELKSLTQEITVVTNASGVATYKTAIERNEGFDDDGLVTATVTATAGGASDTEDVEFDSSNPINGGEVSVELSPASVQESGVLPKAPTTDRVFFDLTTTDQFGNKVGGETVALSDTSDTAAPSAASATSDFVLDGDFSVSATAAQDYVVTAKWTTDSLKYNATPPATTPAQETLSDTGTVNYYAIDYAASSYGIVHSGPNTQPVGSTVTVTYGARDQEGEPIANLFVQFFRTGPDNLQDGDGNFDGVTGQDGAISYVFQGAKAGTAQVTGIGRVATATGDLVAEANKSTSVTFGTVTPPVQQVKINAGLSLRSQGRFDRATVNAPASAKGAAVKLFKVVNGKRVLVAKGKLNAAGDKVFRVRDRNGNKNTRYVAVVSPTAKTKGDTTPTKGTR